MKLYTVENIWEVKSYFWLVSWTVVQSKHIWRDIMASIKSIFWWEIRWFSDMLEQSRKIAMDRMIEDAQKQWANAIINIRYSTSSIWPWMSEVLVYWTAVIL